MFLKFFEQELAKLLDYEISFFLVHSVHIKWYNF